MINAIGQKVCQIEDWERDDAFYALRDEFAGRALQGAIAFEGMARKDGYIAIEASLAYEYADAMMLARKQGMPSCA